MKEAERGTPHGAERRPLKSRNSWWSKRLLELLLRTRVSPDQVSLASVGFAFLAGGALAFSAGAPIPCLLFAAVCIQLRLLCNLLDGMLAVEGGRASRFGVLYNELPDRVADVLIIVGAGIGCRAFDIFGISMLHVAWLAAVLALGTAYVRAFGATLCGEHHFIGPMAKPHRMALLTGALLVEVVLRILGHSIELLPWALVLMIFGLILTLKRRIRKVAEYLQEKP